MSSGSSEPVSAPLNAATKKKIPENIIAARKKELIVSLELKTHDHRQKIYGRDGRKLNARCWTLLHEIFCADDNSNVVDDYYVCRKCREIEYSTCDSGNTDKLNRHKCVQDLEKSLDNTDAEKLKFSVAKFVYKDSQPYSVVEDEGFRDLMKTVYEIGQKNPKVKAETFIADFPCRNTIKNTIKTVFDETVSLIAKEIEQAKCHKSIAIAIDNWTDDHHHNSYCGIVILLSYTQKNGKIIRKQYTLNVDGVDEIRVTKKVMAEHLYRVLLEYGLSSEEVKSIVKIISDRGGNIKYMLHDEGIQHVYCFAHLLNNVVGHMFKNNDVKKLISVASELTSYMKNGGLCNKLDTTLKAYCRTRWNGVYKMFDAILKKFSLIVEALNQKQIALRNAGCLFNQRNPMEYITSVDEQMKC